MNDKPYPPHEEQPMVASEPAVVYGSAAMPRTSHCQPVSYELEMAMRPKKEFEESRFCTQEEKDKMIEEWLQPLTMEQVNRWNEEAEEADEADVMDAFIPHDAVVARMTRWMDSL